MRARSVRSSQFGCNASKLTNRRGGCPIFHSSTRLFLPETLFSHKRIKISRRIGADSFWSITLPLARLLASPASGIRQDRSATVPQFFQAYNLVRQPHSVQDPPLGSFALHVAHREGEILREESHRIPRCTTERRIFQRLGQRFGPRTQTTGGRLRQEALPYFRLDHTLQYV